MDRFCCVIAAKPLTPDVSSTEVTAGVATTLTCASTSITAGMSDVSYVWKLNGKEVKGATTNDRSSTYVTPTLTMENDGDVYTCAVLVNGVPSDGGSVTLSRKFPFLLISHLTTCKVILIETPFFVGTGLSTRHGFM